MISACSSFSSDSFSLQPFCWRLILSWEAQFLLTCLCAEIKIWRGASGEGGSKEWHIQATVKWHIHHSWWGPTWHPNSILPHCPFPCWLCWSFPPAPLPMFLTMSLQVKWLIWLAREHEGCQRRCSQTFLGCLKEIKAIAEPVKMINRLQGMRGRREREGKGMGGRRRERQMGWGEL